MFSYSSYPISAQDPQPTDTHPRTLLHLRATLKRRIINGFEETKVEAPYHVITNMTSYAMYSIFHLLFINVLHTLSTPTVHSHYLLIL
jgi:hypothetical protein